MKARVFYEQWQMQCCGSPITVGGKVVWYVAKFNFNDRYENQYGHIDYSYEAHGEETHMLSGIITAIKVIKYKFLPNDIELTFDELIEVKECDGWQNDVVGENYDMIVEMKDVVLTKCRKFKDDVFVWKSWKPKVFQQPVKLERYLRQLHLKGRKIKDIWLVGIVFSCDHFKQRYIEIDEPIVIDFYDEDALEIDYCDASTVCITLNALPREIRTTYSDGEKFDAKKFFKPCLDETIIDVVVAKSKEPHFTTGANGLELPEDGQEEYVDFMELVLSNGLRLHFSNFYDYGAVSIRKNNGEIYKRALKNKK